MTYSIIDGGSPHRTKPLDQLCPSFTLADMKARAEELTNLPMITREEMPELKALREWIAKLGDECRNDATFVLDEGRMLDGGRMVEIFDSPYRLYPDAISVLQVNKTISLSYKERRLVAEAIEELIPTVRNDDEVALLNGVLERMGGVAVAPKGYGR